MIGFELYLLLINVVTFVVYGVDKRRAVADAWRIPERTLLLLAVIGGSIGAYLGMRIFHHKTRKPLFRYGVPLILVAEGALIVRFFLNGGGDLMSYLF